MMSKNFLYEYQLKHLIRAHSLLKNNANDGASWVNDAAFELADTNTFTNVEDSLSYTKFCATCGQNVVNIIDTESGKIVKRFRDEMTMNRVTEVHLFNPPIEYSTSITSVFLAFL
jgi:hypothetical protein